MQGNRLMSAAGDAQRHRPAHIIAAVELRATVLTFGQHQQRLFRGICRLLPSGQDVFMWVDSELSLCKFPFLFVSKGSVTTECLFCGRHIKVFKICPHFLMHKILTLL